MSPATASIVSETETQEYSSSTVDASTVLMPDQLKPWDQWQDMLGHLRQWWAMEVEDDPDYTPPTKTAIRVASELARSLSTTTMCPAPTRIAGIGDGGISMEWVVGDEAKTVDIEADGETEYFHYIGANMIDSKLLHRKNG